MKQTCLHSRHVAQGALMQPFAGYDMPIQYTSIIEEHNAVRHHCGVFDVSHMGEVVVTDPMLSDSSTICSPMTSVVCLPGRCSTA